MREALCLFEDQNQDDDLAHDDHDVVVEGPVLEASIVWHEDGKEHRSTVSSPMSWHRDREEFKAYLLHSADRLWESFTRYVENTNGYRADNNMKLIDYTPRRPR